MANHPNRSLPPYARALKLWRDREGLTQLEASARCGVPVRTWERLELRSSAPETQAANVAAGIIIELLTPPSATKR